MSSNEAATAGGDIVATAGTYYRVTRYIITLVALGMGLWFGYDGFINWPRQNREIEELERQRTAATAAGDSERAAKLLEDINKVGKHHSESDLRLQRILFFTLPPLALAAIARWLYISRGSYRLTSQNVLHVPGHPAVPLDSITELDKRQWDRKGIAYISYDVGGQTGKLKLDDFLYERQPTDEIYKRIEEHVAPSAVTEPQEEQSAR